MSVAAGGRRPLEEFLRQIPGISTYGAVWKAVKRSDNISLPSETIAAPFGRRSGDRLLLPVLPWTGGFPLNIFQVQVGVSQAAKEVGGVRPAHGPRPDDCVDI